jgi:hypothetical protein
MMNDASAEWTALLIDRHGMNLFKALITNIMLTIGIEAMGITPGPINIITADFAHRFRGHWSLYNI